MQQHASIDFGRDKTQIIKGLAIVLMIIHHTFPNAEAFKICVGIFAFMVGYGYYFAKERTINSGSKRALNLLKKFWFLLFFFILPIAILGGYKWTAKNIATNMLGVEINLNWYSWFLKYYIIAMVMLPTFSRIIQWKPWIGSFIGIIVCYIIITLLHMIPDATTNCWVKWPFDSFLYMPITLLGYLFADRNIYHRLPLKPLTRPVLYSVIGLLLIIGSIVARSYVPGISAFGFDIFYVPVLILGVLMIFNASEYRVFKRIMTELGNKSMWMWWIHALFFTTVTAWFYGVLVTFANFNPYIFTLWVIIASYCLGYLIDLLYDSLQKLTYKCKSKTFFTKEKKE